MDKKIIKYDVEPFLRKTERSYYQPKLPFCSPLPLQSPQSQAISLISASSSAVSSVLSLPSTPLSRASAGGSGSSDSTSRDASSSFVPKMPYKQSVLLFVFTVFLFSGMHVAHGANLVQNLASGGSYTGSTSRTYHQFTADASGAIAGVWVSTIDAISGGDFLDFEISDISTGLASTSCGFLPDGSQGQLFISCGNSTSYINAGDVVTVSVQGHLFGNAAYSADPSNIFPYFQYVDADGASAISIPPDANFMTNIPIFAGTTTLDNGTQYASSTVGSAGLVSSTNLLSFLNVSKLLRTKVPFGYFFEASDAIQKAINATSTDYVVPIGTVQIQLPTGNGTYSTSTFVLFSTSTVSYFLTPSVVSVLRGLMVTILYIEFLYLLYLRGKALHLV